MRTSWARLAVLAVIIALLPLVLGNPYMLDIGIRIGIAAIVCVGLNLLSGYAGQISLGHAGFFALGGYGTALLTSLLGIPGPVSALLAAAAVGLLAYGVARPILKLRGHYLAVATLGFGVIISIVLNREVWLTNGPDGLSVDTLRLFGTRLHAPLLWYAVVGVALLVAVWLAENLVHSPAGRALRALHGSEIAASTAGIDVAQAKAMVFTLSAVLAAGAGAIFVFAEHFITPADAGFLASVTFVTIIVLGGLASSYGAVVGAAILVALPQIIAHLTDYTDILLGLVLILGMIFLPQGVVPSLARLFQRRRSA